MSPAKADALLALVGIRRGLFPDCAALRGRRRRTTACAGARRRMTHEIDLYGVFVPDLLVWLVVAFLISVPLRRLLGALGFYRFVWHRALFDAALFVILLGGVVAASQRFVS